MAYRPEEHLAQPADKSLYERLGGVFAISAVVDHFSAAIVKNPVVGQTSKNPPFQFSPTKPGKTHLGLEEAHRGLKISPAEFDEIAAELGRIHRAAPDLRLWSLYATVTRTSFLVVHGSSVPGGLS